MPHGGIREAITVQFDNEIWDTLEEREVLCPAAPAARACGMDDGRKGAAVVDVGIHRKPEGGLCGDVNAEELEAIAGALSPVPGGVGPMTVSMLLVNTVVAWCRRHGFDHDLSDLVS